MNKKLFWTIIVAALTLRLLSAWFVWGPQALDDYLDALVPAWKLTVGINPEIHDYRSPLFIWILAGWIRVGESFGLTEALYQVRWVYFFLGSCSLLTIYGVSLLTSKQKEFPRGRWLPMWIVAIFGLFPFVSTRCFLESFAIGFLTLGVAFLERWRLQKSRGFFFSILGFLLIGFAALIRFPIGIVYLTYLGLLAWQKNWRGIWIGVFAGFLLLGAEACIDIGFDRAPLATLLAYFHGNNRPEDYGVMPWYNTWITWLGFMFFPFSFLLWKGFKRSWQEYRELWILCLVFVVAHSMFPHKEERFLYPILGLSAILWGTAWAQVFDEKWVRRIYNPIFAVFNCLLIVVGCFINTQAGEVEPPALISLKSHRVLFLDYDSLVGRGWMRTFFIRAPSVLQPVRGPFDKAQLENFAATATWADGIALLTSHPEIESSFQSLQAQDFLGFHCENIQSAASFMDRLIYRANPKSNTRRQPTWYLTCWR